MPVHLRKRPRGGVAFRSGRVLPLAVGLALIVILAAGLGGTSHFGGARWTPHLASSGTAKPPIESQTVAPLRPETIPAGGHGSGSWLIIAAIVIGGLIVAWLLWRLWQMQRTSAAPQLRTTTSAQLTSLTPVDPEPEPEVLLSGIELALIALDEQREPEDAIVRAWLGLQDTAEQSGIVRGSSETPTEFTSRILGHAFADDRAIRTLLRLYLRTRFGHHPVTPDDVSEVRAALERLAASWRGSTATGGR